MNKIARRSFAVILLILLLAGGFTFFLVEYFMNAPAWAVHEGSAHMYTGDQFQGGVVTDRDGQLLLDMEGQWTYSEDAQVRKATLHWIGDREGNILIPAIPSYYEEVVGYSYLNGLYTYGGIGADGGMVELTLSAKLQKVALQAMDGRKGTVAVYNYKTGEILCAVTTPTYDPDNIPDIAGNPETYEGAYMNRFMQAAYTPGSIFKIVTLAAAIDTIPDVQDRQFTCTGSWGEGQHPVTCERKHGQQSLKDAFCNSCNCAFAQISVELGTETLQKYVEKLGIMQSMEFDGISSASGNFESAQDPVDVAWSGIGQYTNLVNPCAFMTFMGAIANDGRGAMPYVVAEADDGGDGYQAQTAYADGMLSRETASVILQYMRYNVTTKYSDDNFPGLAVCAKTGTAEKDDGKTSNGLFSGFVANEQYPYAFFVCVEEGGYGQASCIPVASKVLTACKQLADGTLE